MIPILLAIWLTGAAVVWLMLWIEEEINPRRFEDWGFSVIFSVFWPIILFLAVINRDWW